jgi:hypothetical protein
MHGRLLAPYPTWRCVVNTEDALKIAPCDRDAYRAFLFR